MTRKLTPVLPGKLAGCVLLLAACLGFQKISAAELVEGDYQEFGKLAVQDNGRRKPIDTFAQESMLRITGKSAFEATDGHKWTPNEWVLSMLLETHDWKSEPMILVGHRPLAEKLGLDPATKRFSIEQLAKLPELEKLAKAVHQRRTTEEKPELDRMEQEVESVSGRIGLFMSIAQGATMLVVPPKLSAKEAWVIPPQFGQYYKEQDFAKSTGFLQAMAKGCETGDAFNFSLNARNLRLALRDLSPAIYPSENALALETFYNHLHAFSRAAWLYLLGLIALGIYAARPGAPAAFKWIGISAALAALMFHAAGITLRCFIAGRPPVTNMFESIVWVAFIANVFGFIFFLRYRAALYLLAALPVGALSLALVLNIPIAMPPNIDPLVPVLRDNFWLTIHVLSITAGYGAFFLAMAFGHIVLFRYAMWPEVTRRDATLHFWNYRILQLGTLLLAAGTILGGVWANYSWGRFWGWDPKETWALIALLCYIVALHGRIAGWWSHFGLAMASCVCFLAVLMAWYGVNFVLGKGLHSYGFGIGGEGYVAGFLLIDGLFLAFAAYRHLSSEKVRRAGLRANVENDKPLEDPATA
jgi:ABC-type transport system involved in cytochrome c biogenesis permease subunit